MFAKTVIKQGKELVELHEENEALHRENEALHKGNKLLYEEKRKTDLKLLELEEYKKQNEKIKENIIMDLLNLQEINRLGVSEEEKNKHRNVIINKLIKELSASRQTNK